jgi:hypothetical protein
MVIGVVRAGADGQSWLGEQGIHRYYSSVISISPQGEGVGVALLASAS